MRRITQLDGLRGLAALAVVIHHSFLVAPVFGSPDFNAPSPSDGWEWWAEYTPLHTFWNGGAAVMVFFVLSGFVLVLPFLEKREKSLWLEYFPRRLVRLYVPVWGSIAFTMMLFILFPRTTDPIHSWWINRHDVPLALKPIVADMVLVRGTSWYNSPLWSLQFEVLFSLLLPIFLYAATKLRRHWVALSATLLLMVHVGEMLDIRSVQYLPVFMLGVLMGVRRDLLDKLASRASTPLWFLTVSVAIVLIHVGTLPGWTRSLAVVVLGSSVLVVVFYGWTSARRLGNSVPAQWLGKRSFSIYLTHEPVIVSVANVTGWTDPLAVLGLSLPLALGAGSIFYRLVEGPSHGLSRRAGRCVSTFQR